MIGDEVGIAVIGDEVGIAVVAVGGVGVGICDGKWDELGISDGESVGFGVGGGVIGDEVGIAVIGDEVGIAVVAVGGLQVIGDEVGITVVAVGVLQVIGDEVGITVVSPRVISLSGSSAVAVTAAKPQAMNRTERQSFILEVSGIASNELWCLCWSSSHSEYSSKKEATFEIGFQRIPT